MYCEYHGANAIEKQIEQIKSWICKLSKKILSYASGLDQWTGTLYGALF